MAIVGVLFKVSRVCAQILPDETLGTESSVVVPLAPGYPVELIFGGATRGANLFHSFQQFDIGEIRAAYFLPPPEIKNILSRVTGGSRSEILGTLGVIGDANLFLINPNGIIFGQKASLDIGGSFVATTANAIAFDTQGFFSASAPNVPPILTVNPSAFLFNQIAAKSITIQSASGLQVPDGRSLLLVGGNIELQAGQLKAPGGSIKLGGVAEAATVGLKIDGNNLHLSFPAGVQLANISLTEKAIVDTSGEGSGAIQLSGKRITLTDGSKIEANTIGSEPGGTITVTAESLEVLAGSRLLTQTIGDGAAGDLTIETRQLIVKDGAQVGSVTFSTGQGGTLTVSASKFVQLIGTSADGVDVSGLFTQTEGAGAAGNLTLKTGQLTVKDGAQVSVSTVDAGQGGKLSVTAQQSVQLIGTSANGNPSGLFAVTQGGSGAAGDLTVETGQLIVQDGAQVSASTFGGATGKGGTLNITADSVQLMGTSTNSQFRSGLLVGTAGTAAAGDLTVETGQLTVQNGAVVSAGTLGQGQGGKLTITAKKSVQLVGTSADGQFFSSLLTQTSGAGAAGDLKIATGQLIVQDGAQVNVSSQGTGNAGNLEIEAGSILLDNKAALTATTKSGNGGNITLQVQDLLQLRHGSSISTTAGTDKAGGNGGNMEIDAKFIVAVPAENSDITANAFEGRGGNINITTSGIFGTQFRPRLTPESDITASSEFGVDGAVNINTLEVDPSRGLATLPTELVDASGLIAQTCPASGNQVASSFTVTGSGGLPDNPGDARSSNAVWTDWRISQNSRPNRLIHAAKASIRSSSTVAISQANSTAMPLVEATGWGRNHQGEVVLMAAVSSSPDIELVSQCDR
ncbi:filamentous hemagglutinin N-terminal domain-containing protein [Coleofasciculus sp. H7-2]|uniref:two-partner secretion domain-containing protein n=1 Tax=Coleofasciculus sp. H7-2 TaxID=3351545 RepID=UPI003672CBCD